VVAAKDDCSAPFARVWRRYRAEAPTDELPTRARLWVALHDGEQRILVDQQNLRVWIADGPSVHEIKNGNPLERIQSAASLVAPKDLR
jgi:hypothetical protein